MRATTGAPASRVRARACLTLSTTQRRTLALLLFTITAQTSSTWEMMAEHSGKSQEYSMAHLRKLQGGPPGYPSALLTNSPAPYSTTTHITFSLATITVGSTTGAIRVARPGLAVLLVSDRE